MTTTTQSRVTNERHVMSYTFAPAADDAARIPFADMKAFRTWAAENLDIADGQSLVVHGTSVNDGMTEFGKLRWVKDTGRGPTFVQPDPDLTVTLEDVLADIDALDIEDDALIEDMDGDGSDFEDEQPIIGAAERAGIPPLDAPRPAGKVRHARMSHKDCGHPLTPEARAVCRAERRASAA